jgi:hypothetical protein
VDFAPAEDGMVTDNYRPFLVNRSNHTPALRTKTKPPPIAHQLTLFTSAIAPDKDCSLVCDETDGLEDRPFWALDTAPPTLSTGFIFSEKSNR